jgi:hypothetical protein
MPWNLQDSCRMVLKFLPWRKPLPKKSSYKQNPRAMPISAGFRFFQSIRPMVDSASGDWPAVLAF